MTTPATYSVVVASFRDAELLAQCLETLLPQCRAHGAELLVVRSERERPERLRAITEGCRVVSALPGDGVPELRGRGMSVAAGDWVAVTEDNCVADPGWLSALRAASGPGAAVLGGAMGNAHHGRRIDCGAFFAEYGFFGANAAVVKPDAVPLVTGANVAYARAVVAEAARWAAEGAWENTIHDRLHAEGHRFRLVPEARVRQNLHYSLGAFATDRFAHGRDFAATRAQTLPLWKRIVFAATTPLLPFVLARRVARAVAPSERTHFGRALPATLAFLAAWAAGEAIGYLLGHSKT